MAIELNLESLSNGGAVERLLKELKNVLENCLDPNTEAKKARKVKLEITVKPNEQRTTADLKITTSSTLCPAMPLETSIYMGKDLKSGEVSAKEIAAGEAFNQHSFPGTMETGKFLESGAKVSNLSR